VLRAVHVDGGRPHSSSSNLRGGVSAPVVVSWARHLTRNTPSTHNFLRGSDGRAGHMWRTDDPQQQLFMHSFAHLPDRPVCDSGGREISPRASQVLARASHHAGGFDDNMTPLDAAQIKIRQHCVCICVGVSPDAHAFTGAGLCIGPRRHGPMLQNGEKAKGSLGIRTVHAKHLANQSRGGALRVNGLKAQLPRAGGCRGSMAVRGDESCGRLKRRGRSDGVPHHRICGDGRRPWFGA
jgi:hypothetical protein